jgi:flavorubredoxin
MMIPFAHWPDNYMVHLKEDNILFSSDLFGSHYATSKAFSTSVLAATGSKELFCEIMLPYRSHVAKYVKRVRELGPRMIAPSHGPVWYDLILSCAVMSVGRRFCEESCSYSLCQYA